ncbi:MAG: hypothetical protein JXR96_20645, partial [Deltaproteobacteria bacterium]|nr:hypothetical protein [Deltaproteobacteria bacterium]
GFDPSDIGCGDREDQIIHSDCVRRGVPRQTHPDEAISANPLHCGKSRGAFIVARDEGWICVTADKPMWELCEQRGVEYKYIRGLRVLTELVRQGHLDAEVAVRISEAISEINPYITRDVLAEFKKIIESL